MLVDGTFATGFHFVTPWGFFSFANKRASRWFDEYRLMPFTQHWLCRLGARQLTGIPEPHFSLPLSPGAATVPAQLQRLGALVMFSQPAGGKSWSGIRVSDSRACALSQALSLA